VTTIGQIVGISHSAATRLRKAGIRTTESFLEWVDSPGRLGELAEMTGIEHEQLLDMAASVGLTRLEGMGGRYSALLRAAGIHSLADLGGYSVAEVLRALTAANFEHRIVRRLPSSVTVDFWIRAANDRTEAQKN
jgi:predicted flap endonuclease-1-like 5' DNA nuclease